MLSYRHAFHAGNHADVLKHFVLVELIRHLSQKETGFLMVDTHAGAGVYGLDTGYATRLAEYIDGVDRLFQRNDTPSAMVPYLNLVREFNPSGELKAYPGSPWFAQRLMRPQDKLRLYELHSSDSALLQDNFRALNQATQRRTIISASDGFIGLKASMPPQTRRGLVLIDPSYEDKTDYRTIPNALTDALSRFATGTYAVWYPQLSSAESLRFPTALKALPAKSWLNVSLTINSPRADGFGMHGSGMFILNPPWTLQKTLESVMLYLVEVLGLDEGAGYVLESAEN
jgi:23S rRNA (adenine2030-N6)-methyltransferase